MITGIDLSIIKHPLNCLLWVDSSTLRAKTLDSRLLAVASGTMAEEIQEEVVVEEMMTVKVAMVKVPSCWRELLH